MNHDSENQKPNFETIDQKAINSGFEAQIPTREPHKGHKLAKGAGAALAVLAMVGGAVNFREHSDAQTDPTEQTDNFPQTTRPAAATKLSTTTLPTSTISMPSGAEANTTISESLKNPNSLPGIDMLVTKEQRTQLKESMIEIKSKKKGSNVYDNTCTGVKIGADTIATAGHCLINGLAGTTHGTGVEDVTDIINHEYFIADNGQQIAKVNKITTNFSNNSPDLTFFEVAATGNNFANARSWTDIKAMEFSNFNTGDSQLGQQVALYGFSETRGALAVEGTGILLGRIKSPFNDSMVDIVGLRDVVNKSKDACYLGTSGEIGITADNKKLGPLTLRVNINDIDPATNKPDPEKYAKIKKSIQDQLGIDLSEFPTICGFTVVTSEILQISSTGSGMEFKMPHVIDTQKVTVGSGATPTH